MYCKVCDKGTLFMIQTANRQEAIQALKGKISAAYEYLIEHKDRENAEKVKQLAGKLASGEFTIAFCGHFSAGKSTMINRLVGENLLPSSPIPTSANLVRVKAGEAYAKVFFKNEKPRLYFAPYDYQMVKNYCKDGDQIHAIEISHADSQLPEHTVIMDTPGIDSADDAHRIATESAIHLADLILYVMDYNHVQSELNFMFTKELTEAGKEVYLVINQVDKHADKELSFSSFQTSVVESFASWGVKPADIFYTSLKKADHVYNQFPLLQDFVAERLKVKDDLLLASIFHSLQKIVKDHLDLIKRQNEAVLKPFRNILNELSVQEQESLGATYSRLHEEKHALGGRGEKAEKEFDAEVNKILANAYLMPFQTRALAESYLASCQSKFKVGLLFSKQKTLAEKQERLQLFYEDILEKTKSQVEWHLRDFLRRFLKEKQVENKELLLKIQNLKVDFSDEVLTTAVKTGANLSGEYVLNYTNDVANEIGRIAKRVVAALKSEILPVLRDKNTALQLKLSQKSSGVERYINALEQVKQYELAGRLEQTRIETLLMQTDRMESDRFQLFAIQEEDFEVVHGKPGAIEQIQKKSNPPQDKPAHQENNAPSAQSSDSMKETTEKLQKTARLVHDLPGFSKIAGELMEKAERLAHKGFTVALFGAFSAGKSSFANALIGESVLPVSPNPTTAAINKIKPIQASYPHGTVLIKIKEERAMLEDVNHALKMFDVQAKDLAEAVIAAEKLKGQLRQCGVAEKINYAFLQAFIRGYGTFCEQLGTVRDTTIREFSDYVTIEEKSCFVEWIELYYDCPLTRKGITLVDTPGADSINARHTGVAFDFIKNSDAILFVTYYNHAFSKADREFLIQLGRVKDSFQLDKMFFVINAIDLADDESEQETVIAYVREHLIKYGVKNPHLYSLSSLNALAEKQGNVPFCRSGMAVFAESFYHFIAYDLASMAVVASENELRRVYDLVEKLIAHTKEGTVVQQQKRAHIETEKALLNEIFARQTAQHCKNRLDQEIEELIYYIKQRVFLRFNEFFKESFNPSVLREDGRNLKKVLQQALEEFLAQIGFDFAQEMRATTIRLDRFAEKMIAEYQITLVEQVHEMNQEVSFSFFEFEDSAQMHFESAFKELPYGMFTEAMAYFKSTKSFFENNENKFMRDALYQLLNTAADVCLENEQKRIQAVYGNVMEAAFGELILQMTDEADAFYLSLLSALAGGVSAEALTNIQQRLREFMHKDGAGNKKTLT